MFFYIETSKKKSFEKPNDNDFAQIFITKHMENTSDLQFYV